MGRLSVASCGLLLLLDGCRQGYEECTPGDVRSCPIQLCVGRQTCGAEGFFEGCDCTATGGVAGFGPGGVGGFGVGGTGFIGAGGTGGFGLTGGTGGSFGKGGTFGIGGGGTGGSLGTGGSPGRIGGIGSECTANSQCIVGLECITPASDKLGGGAPAHGYCAAPCVITGASSECAAFRMGSVCHDFGSSSLPSDAGVRPGKYCVEGCSFGPLGLQNFDAAKCHGRHDVACSPLLEPTSTPCSSDSNCATGQVCRSSRCQVVLSGCLPRCNADADCAPGLFCNPGDGLCRVETPSGKPLGQECSPVSDAGVGVCRGDCEAFTSAGRTEHICVEGCTIGARPSCGWTGVPGVPAPALCLLASTLVIDHGGPAIGDLGTCAQTCDCNRDCAHPALICRDFANPTVQQVVGRRGYCSAPTAGDAGIERGIACD